MIFSQFSVLEEKFNKPMAFYESLFLYINNSAWLSQGQPPLLSYRGLIKYSALPSSDLASSKSLAELSSSSQLSSTTCLIMPQFLLRDTNNMLVHHLLDPDPSPKAEALDPPVVEQGPAVRVDKGGTEKEDEEVD